MTTRPGASSIAAALATAVLLLPAVPAHAHTRLVDSEPSAGQQVPAPPEEVRLVFSSPVDDRFARVALTAADGPAQELPVEVDGQVLVAELPADAAGRAGQWRIDFRVVSSDGHPVAGTVPFDVRAVGQPTPSAVTGAAPQSPVAPRPAGAAAPAAPDDEEQAPVWPWAAGAVLLLGGGLLALRRRGPAEG